jgi:hypothetical protein
MAEQQRRIGAVESKKSRYEMITLAAKLSVMSSKPGIGT